jgi:hypothetical protein
VLACPGRSQGQHGAAEPRLALTNWQRHSKRTTAVAWNYQDVGSPREETCPNRALIFKTEKDARLISKNCRFDSGFERILAESDRRQAGTPRTRSRLEMATIVKATTISTNSQVFRFCRSPSNAAERPTSASAKKKTPSAARILIPISM